MTGWLLMATMNGYLMLIASPDGWTKEQCEASAVVWERENPIDAEPICIPAGAIPEIVFG